jgi:hypothetical protein
MKLNKATLRDKKIKDYGDLSRYLILEKWAIPLGWYPW